jgi:hypothetical protein
MAIISLPFRRHSNMKLLLVVLGFFACAVVQAANPFSSNVVELTAKNWKEEVEDSPHAVFVNICRQG